MKYFLITKLYLWKVLIYKNNKLNSDILIENKVIKNKMYNKNQLCNKYIIDKIVLYK